MRLRLTAQAFEDLADISAFGAEMWGEPLARKYAAELAARLARLSEFPLLGPPEPLIDGVRRLSAGRHVAFYKVMGDEIVVGRVLHGARDQVEHIAPDFS